MKVEKIGIVLFLIAMSGIGVAEAAVNPCATLTLHQEMLSCVSAAGEDTAAVEQCAADRTAQEQACKAKQVIWEGEGDPLPADVLFCQDPYIQYQEELCKRTGNGAAVCTARTQKLRGQCADPDRRLYGQELSQWIQDKQQRLASGKIAMDREIVPPALLNTLVLKELRALGSDVWITIDLHELKDISQNFYQYIKTDHPELFGSLATEVTVQGMMEDPNLTNAAAEQVRTALNLPSVVDVWRLKRWMSELGDRNASLQLLSFYTELTSAQQATINNYDGHLLRGLLAGNPELLPEMWAQRIMWDLYAARLRDNSSSMTAEGKEVTEQSAAQMDMLVTLRSDRSDLLKRIETLITKAETTKLAMAERVSALRDILTIVNSISADHKDVNYEKGFTPFRDTDINDWFIPYVAKAKERGVISGYKDTRGRATGEFGPGNPVTECEVLKIALETAKLGMSTKVPQNPKVQNHWCAGYAARAEELHLSIAATLTPDHPATRKEVVRTMLEATGVPVPQFVRQQRFTDVADTGAFLPYIALAEKLGIVSGVNNSDIFAPNDPINRAAMAKVAVNVLDLVMKPIEDEAMQETLRQELEANQVIQYN